MDENLSDAIVMNLVVNSGEARSIAMEAIELARQGQFEEAAAKIAEAARPSMRPTTSRPSLCRRRSTTIPSP